MGASCTNCATSTSLGLLLCYKGCNAEKVRNSFVFLPPRPSYVVEVDSKDPSRRCIKYTIGWLNTDPIYKQAAVASEVRYVTTRKGETVPVVWIHNRKASSSASESPVVLLHCHGNATDIGLMMGPYYELAKALDIEVLGVEYSGYGRSTGEPSSGNNHADVEAAYDLLVNSGVPQNKIVGYGQSIGSGPIAGLGCKRQLGGIILHSPLLSGIKVIDPYPERCCRPSCVCACFDFFRVERCVRQVKCPVFIMHGKIDDVVPFYHGIRLYDAIPTAHRWPAYFPERGGHNDLPDADKHAYFQQVYNFLWDVRQRANASQVVSSSQSEPTQAAATSPRRSKQVEMSCIQATASASPIASPPQKDSEQQRGSFSLFACGHRRSVPRRPSRSPDLSEDNSGDAADQQPRTIDVAVGPTDGRYSVARQGSLHVASRGGNNPNTQALQPVCQRDVRTPLMSS